MLSAVANYKNRILRKIYERKGVKPSVLNNLDAATAFDRSLPIGEAQYVVFDTELTGLEPKKDSIVSIGAIRMQGGRINMSDTFYCVVDPRTKLTGHSVVIHNITPTEASQCPSIELLLPEFLTFCGNSIVVGHFVSIDLNFINFEMKRLYGFTLQNAAVDTLKLYKWMREKEENFCAYHGGSSEDLSLLALAKKYGIPVNGAHNAVVDAYVTAQLFQRFISSIGRFGISNVGDLLKIGLTSRR